MNYAVAYKPTFLDRLRWKLFPSDRCEIPDIPASDCVIVRSNFRLSLLDRLRVVISGRIEVETKTATEHVVGNCASNALLNVQAPAFMDRKQ